MPGYLGTVPVQGTGHDVTGPSFLPEAVTTKCAHTSEGGEGTQLSKLTDIFVSMSLFFPLAVPLGPRECFPSNNKSTPQKWRRECLQPIRELSYWKHSLLLCLFPPLSSTQTTTQGTSHRNSYFNRLPVASEGNQLGTAHLLPAAVKSLSSLSAV